MATDPEPIISSDSFDKYGLNDRCRVSKERVQDFVDRGFMTQDAVYARYTENLAERLVSEQRSTQPNVIENIRTSFQHLRDPATGCLSPDLFKHQITQHFLGLSIVSPQQSFTTLFSLLAFHAFHPFPFSDASPPQFSSHFAISEDAFVRAICLLTLSPFPFQGPDSSATHRYYSGVWGPHRGGYIAQRGKDAGDFRRRVFRSIAIPSDTTFSQATTIQAPRFEYYEQLDERKRDEGLSDGDDVGTKILVVAEEKEVEIDIADALSECPPEEDRLIANPFRESYRLVLPNLPQHKEDLTELFVFNRSLLELMTVISEIQQASVVDCAGAIDRLSSDGKIGWREFDFVMAEHSGLIAEGLRKIFGAFAFAEI